mgnify:FL=1
MVVVNDRVGISVVRCQGSDTDGVPHRVLTVGVMCMVWLLLGWSAALATESAGQTDWSGGPDGTVVGPSWGRGFSASEGISWLAVPGQLTLSGEVLDTAVQYGISDSFFRPSSLDLADIDGDGDLDLVGAAFGAHQVRWWRNEGGSPPEWTPLTIETGFAAAASVRAADVDRDGSMDVVACAWTDGELVLLANDGQGVSWTRQSVATGLSECHWADVADLNGDGAPDLMAAAADPGMVAVWISDGGMPVAWTEQIIDDAFGGARSLVPADLDADGDQDLIGTALVDDDLSWWRNDGGEPLVWTRQILSDSLGGSHHADAWDMDLDGDLDIVAAGFGHPWLKLWRHNGEDPVGWTEEQIDGVIMTPLVVDAGDLDGDGDMDLVATSNNWNRVMWWENNGGPVETWEVFDVVRNFPNAWPVTTGDLDGDGRLEIVSGASAGSDVAWWRLADFVDQGVLESAVLEIAGNVVEITVGVDATIPVGTGVAVAFRIGSAPGEMGEWTPVEPGQPRTVLLRGPASLQYRVELSTVDPSVAPVVRSVDFAWSSELEVRAGGGGRVQP